MGFDGETAGQVSQSFSATKRDPTQKIAPGIERSGQGDAKPRLNTYLFFQPVCLFPQFFGTPPRGQPPGLSDNMLVQWSLRDSLLAWMHFHSGKGSRTGRRFANLGSNRRFWAVPKLPRNMRARNVLGQLLTKIVKIMSSFVNLTRNFSRVRVLFGKKGK